MRHAGQVDSALSAGAHHVVRLYDGNMAEQVGEIAPAGVDRIAETDLAGNVDADLEVLKYNGVIAT
ncbi:hypothetical protein [Streptomyces sp. NBC_01716]|uniref:hypothetical protein n=1 Tax=Streptomyces sp. NBC_01716 TaxID=2975917 RepID=UPI002E2FE151|nr:hypothetical protein [Streptomyces sp. NBC_01716]